MKTLIALVILFISHYCNSKGDVSAKFDLDIRHNNLDIKTVDSTHDDSQKKSYVLLFSIAEQINQASKGIKQVIKLAKETNRTFVIPYVSSSRVRAPSYANSKLLSLSAYYDMDHIKNEYYPNIIEYHEFLEQASSIPIRPFALDHFGRSNKELKKESKSRLSRVFRHGNHTVNAPIIYSFLKSKERSHKAVISLMNEYEDETIAFAPFDRYLWNEGGVPEFFPSKFLMYEVERFKNDNEMKDGYISIQWRFERSAVSECREILKRIIETVEEYLLEHPNTKIHLGTDLDFKFGSSTLDKREYETFKPVLDELIASLPIKPIIYSPTLSPFDYVIDRGMVGIIEQELFIGSDLFIPAMVRSGFVKTVLRRREAESKHSRILLEKDMRIWERDRKSVV